MRAAAAHGRGRRAVVVGGGIGGLLAGLVLRSRFDRVTVLERDRSPEGVSPRRGAPQGRCLHLLAAEGLRVIEGLLPGFSAALERAGAIGFDVGEEAAVRLSSGWLPRVSAGIRVLACSRGLLEQELRRRAEATPGLRLAHGHAVRGLVGDAARVTGVRVEAEGRAWDELADLTVAAAGGRSALPRWWAGLGLPSVPCTVAAARCGYVSRWFRIPTSFEGEWRLLSITPAPGVAWGGAVLQDEAGRWGVVLLVPRGEAVPDSDDGFLRACGRLADARIAQALRNARPLTPIVRHEHVDGRWLHLDRTSCWPDGLVVLGDAACVLDPYFGLGMTACARGVAALAEHALHEPGAAHAFQRHLAGVLEAPWRLATERDPADPAAAYYRRSLLQLAPRHPALARVLLRRMHLLDPPEALERPEVVARVREVLTGARGRPSPA